MEYRLADSSQTTILIVDDQTENLTILAGMLQPHYRVKAARSGKQALQIAKTLPPPDMILLDLMMPEMDGFEVLKCLGAEPETADIPVIFVTASNDFKDEEAAFKLGAVDYITKPIQPPVALARVRLHLSLKHAHNELAQNNILLEERVGERTKQLEEYQQQLLQAEKTASIGLLTGGIAHDFNNILTPIIGYCELLMDDLRSDNRLYDDVLQIFLASLRAKDLVGEILEFARKSESPKKPIRLSSIVKETLKLLQVSLPATIELRQEFDQEAATAMINAEPSQAQSILMNLCTNAVHAMDDNNGVLSVEMAMAGQEDDLFLQSRQVKTPALRLTVSDTGSGMDETILGHIFDPYFTTKPPGKGTGLGLPVAHGIVMDLGGAIDIKSQAGVGSAFTVYLPVLAESAIVASPVTNARLPKKPADALVILIDDDEAALALERQLLERLGMRVETYMKGSEALARFLDRPNEADLVITGQTMPQLTGVQLAKEMTTVRPSLPILLCSDNPQVLTPDQCWDDGISLVLAKPFEAQALLDALRQLGITEDA